MTARCEPPPEYRAVRWHWLIRDEEYGPEPMRWAENSERSPGFWITRHWHYAPDEMAALGWRYLGPALPPEVKG